MRSGCSATRCPATARRSARALSLAPTPPAAGVQRVLTIERAASSQSLRRRATIVRARGDAYGPGGEEAGGGEGGGQMVARLNALLVANPPMTAEELRQLVMDKWGRSYDIRLTRRSNQMILQVMWKCLEQKSFWLTEEQYLEQLDAVSFFLNQWGVSDRVRKGIASARARGPGYTGGNGARCISIPLDVDMSGLRSSEWN